MNETKYKKNRYPNDDTKRKQKIPEVTEKENTGTTNLKQYRKGTYDNEKDSQSNIYSRSTKYLEIQRKLYNNFYVKPEMDFQYFSDKSNDKSNKCCECLNKKKSYDELSSSTKFHYNYLDNSKKVCAVDVCACFLSSAATGIAGNIPPTFAAAKAAVTSLESALQTSYSTAVLTKLSNALASVNLSSQSAIVGAIISGVIPGVSSATASSTTVAKAATAAAIDFARQEGIKEGIHVVIEKIKDLPFISNYLNVQWTKFINGSNYNTVSGLVQAVKDAVHSTANTCTPPSGQFGKVCQSISNGEATFRSVVEAGQEAAASTTGTVQKSALDTIEIATTTCTTAITASVIAIVVIVLVLVIIYLILRYRRKKKINKKVQYTKLFNK
ncbi:hypothetical protein PFNF135_02404 [Plasmodium falciparum NF135/5.C10]|uniref:Surface antigen n=1 Tax=Plasmodium falciparum NF135/5.C10 TaxID=1036726 RepID=W4IIL1_PLAFA|nr:hypothetical protein PFNF135_02404 [Plasmodium falciparum NF135/5.C10]